jgi:hypothetical protein
MFLYICYLEVLFSFQCYAMFMFLQEALLVVKIWNPCGNGNCFYTECALVRVIIYFDIYIN